MKVSYFDDTDTLYIEFNNTDVLESRDLDENTLLDLDTDGNIIGITLEHTCTRSAVSKLQLAGIAA
jgi:uncharacterized protein YuzE